MFSSPLSSLPSRLIHKKAAINPQQQQKQLIINEKINNITSTVSHNDTDYYLMIKKQSNQDFCYLFMTDYDVHFWLQKIDYEYLEYLKANMKIQTSMLAFVQYLAQGFSKRVEILEVFPFARIKVSLRIMQGLTINTTINFAIHIDQDNQPDQHLLLLKGFFRQYHSIKQSQQIKSKQLQCQSSRRNHKQQDQHQNPDTIKKSETNIFGDNKNLGNRDLINPIRKKRRGLGMRLQGSRQPQKNEKRQRNRREKHSSSSSSSQ